MRIPAAIKLLVGLGVGCYLSSNYSLAASLSTGLKPASTGPQHTRDRYVLIDNLLLAKPQTGKCQDAFFSVMYNSFDPQVIRDTIKRCPDHLKKTFYQIPPQHLAVMASNAEAEDQLLAAGVDVNAQDLQGYTAMHHHALLGNTVGVDKLLARGADPTLRTNFGATYMDFLRFNQPFRPNNYPLDPKLFSAHRHPNLHDISPACLNPGYQFVDEMVARPKSLIENWKLTSPPILKSELENTSKFILHLNKNVNEKYLEFKANPPKLSIKPVETDDLKLPLTMANRPCGLFATSLIKRGEVLAEYTGEYLAGENVDYLDLDSTYLWKDQPAVQANHFRSAAAMANDAFPNAYVENIQFNGEYKPGLDGLMKRKLMIALEDIAPGEQIVINYGNLDLTKNEAHLELRPKALVEFCGKNSWMSLFDAKVEKVVTLEDSLNLVNSMVKLDYILQTPTTLPFLIDKDLFKKNDLTLLQAYTAKPSLNPAARGVAQRALAIAKRRLRQKDEL